MKKIKYFLLAGIIALFINSCIGFEQKDLFNESSANRLEQFLSDAEEVLISAENGWTMEYFTTKDSPGVTFIMKFHPNSMVSIGSKSVETDAFRIDSCYYEVISGNGPILSFSVRSEYNDFHYFSDPQSFSTKEEIGDYEFIIIEFDKDKRDKMKLKGSKKGVYIHMNKLPTDYDWKEYIDDISAFHDLIFGNYAYAQGSWFITLVSSETKIEASNGQIHNFSFVKEGLDAVFDTEQVPFILYTDGLRFQHPYEVDSKTIQTFRISDDKHRLLCIDEGSTDIYFVGRNPISKLIEDKEKENRNEWMIDANTASDNLTKLFEEVAKTIYDLTGGGINILEMFFSYSALNGDYAFGFSEGIAKGTFYLESQIVGDKITLMYKGRNDRNGDVYSRLGGEKFIELMDLVCRTYIVSPNPISNLNLRTIKFTADNDAGFSFLLSL